mgnify:CR=1 FL=1
MSAHSKIRSNSIAGAAMANDKKLDIDIYRGPTGVDKLREAISLCQPKAEFVILESLTETRFPKAAAAKIDPEQYPKGRLFAPTFEFRWETGEQGTVSVLATERKNGWPNALTELFVPDTSVEQAYQNGYCDTEKDYSVFLRPENDATLGRTLRYEQLSATGRKNGKNAKLEIKRYFSATGRLLFWRYRNMRWEP